MALAASAAADMTPRKGRRNEPLADRLLRKIETTGAVHRWPSMLWRDDPEGFARDVLLVDALTDDQLAILRAINKVRARVSVASGHKLGKDFLAALIALWWFCSDEKARVRATAVNAPQVRDIFWREVRTHFERSKRGPYPIDGNMNLMPHNGLRCGLREIVGFTAAQQEGAAGISGPRVLYIFDEASGIDDSIFEAAKGNLAGGDARVLMLSQPTKNSGHFYDSHHEKRELWSCFNLDSEKSPNVIAGRDIIPGLATREWLEEMAIDWNAPEGAVWKIRVKGQFAEGSDFKVMPYGVVAEAEKRWADMPITTDPLVVGFDCAGMGADENAAAARRGNKILEIEAWSGANFVDNDRAARETAARLMRFVRKHRRRRELPTLVVMDAGGTVGIRVYGALRAREYKDEIIVVPVQFGAASTMQREYTWMRDQLWFGFARWLNEGGSLPPDRKLPAELTAPSWDYDERSRKHVEKKDKLRQRLGRSTDRADACILCVHEPRGGAAAQAQHEREAPEHARVDNDPIYGGAADVYGGGDTIYGG
jgi:phage terminase large subunit